jgi:hypothetical protein
MRPLSVIWRITRRQLDGVSWTMLLPPSAYVELA